MKRILVIILSVIILGCNTTPEISLPPESFYFTSDDPEYGYKSDKPVELGGFLVGTKSWNKHFEYFNGLLGPNGEQVKVDRLGSCCEFEDKTLPLGGGLLDRYILTYKGQKTPAIIYVNLYKFNKPKAPKGFSLL